MGARLAELSLTLRELLDRQQNAQRNEADAESSVGGDGRVAAIEGGAHESEGSADEAARATAATPEPSMQQAAPVIVHEPPQQQAAAVAIRAEVIAVARPLPHHS